MLGWIMNDSMRRAVHKCTTKIERHHKFAKHLAFGEHGLLRSKRSIGSRKGHRLQRTGRKRRGIAERRGSNPGATYAQIPGNPLQQRGPRLLKSLWHQQSETLWQFSDGPDTGPGAGGEGSAVMMDGTMTVSDDGGKPIVEET
jgi:hypothetical protein